MIRVLLFFGLLFLVAMGFAWMADLPGVISISWQGYVWEQPPVVVAVVGGLLLAVFLLAVWALRVVMNSPKIASRFFQRRRKDKGYHALSQGLIALGTGNAKLARRHGLDAEKLLQDEPAAKLLLAQTAQLAGKDDEARARFEAMLAASDTRALGLHGLFVEAERQREPVAARHYAEEAAKLVPGLDWAGKAVLGYQAVANHWDQALQTLERNYTAKLIDKKTYRRQRAVILTALAHQMEDRDPDRAYALAKEAHGLAIDLVPAAVLASRFATRRGDIRKASKVIEAAWRLSPHPDLADTYAHVRTGDSAIDRLKRVKALAAQKANTAVGARAIARAAMEAREFGEAREQLKKVLRSEPTRGAFLMMAELEELEHGDRGRTREWLARAVRAPFDKAWVADGVISPEWQAVSPVTGRLDAFEWTTPGALPDAEEGPVLEDSLFDGPAAASALPIETAVTSPETTLGSDSVSGTVGEETALTAAAPAEKTAETATAELELTLRHGGGKQEPDGPSAPRQSAAAPAPVQRTGVEGTTDDVATSPSMQALPDAPPVAEAAPLQTPSPEGDRALELATGPVAPSDPSNEAADQQAPSNGAEMPAAEAQRAAPGEPAASKDASDETGVSDAGAKKPSDQPDLKAGKKARQETDLDQPIAFALDRMPDDPGPEEDDEPAKAPRQRLFN